MAELLALLVMDRLAAEPSDVVVDAYSGVGTFALLLAPLVREVIGIEEASTAVTTPSTTRATSQRAFHPGQDRSRPAVAVSAPDAVVLDPARAGCHPDVLQALLETRPGRVVYVSCDPSHPGARPARPGRRRLPRCTKSSRWTCFRRRTTSSASPRSRADQRIWVINQQAATVGRTPNTNRRAASTTLNRLARPQANHIGT